MGYRDSYLRRLRQAVGNDLVLMPGAMVALQREDGRVLLTKRADDGTWCLPAGAAEPGGSFTRTAVDELAEEFFDLGALPEPLHAPTTDALELLAAYLTSGTFQVR